MKLVHVVAFVLVIVGGINWGFVGLLNFNFVSMVFGTVPSFENFVYILVGAAAVYLLATHATNCKACKGK